MQFVTGQNLLSLDPNNIDHVYVNAQYKPRWWMSVLSVPKTEAFNVSDPTDLGKRTFQSHKKYDSFRPIL